MSTYPPSTGYGSDGARKLCARLDLRSAKIVDDVSIDDEVTIIVKGKVKSLEGGREYKEKEYMGKDKMKDVVRKYPGNIEIEISEMRVSKEGEFDAMLED